MCKKICHTFLLRQSHSGGELWELRIYPKKASRRPLCKFVFSAMLVAKDFTCSQLYFTSFRKVKHVLLQSLYHFHLFFSDESYPLYIVWPCFAKFHSLCEWKSQVPPSMILALPQHISTTPLHQSSLVLSGSLYHSGVQQLIVLTRQCCYRFPESLEVTNLVRPPHHGSWW